MDATKNKKNKNEYLEDFARAKQFFIKAQSYLDLDLDLAVNRIYLSYENVSHSILKKKHEHVSKKHAKIWEGMQKLFYQGILSFDPKPFLLKSYKYHLFVDYGRKEFQDENIEFNKENVEELLKVLEKLINEIEEIIK